MYLTAICAPAVASGPIACWPPCWLIQPMVTGGERRVGLAGLAVDVGQVVGHRLRARAAAGRRRSRSVAAALLVAAAEVLVAAALLL